ncbi:MAG: saccharopine dehydrogenase [Bacteroidetes bacterium 4572_114]|nr:MAG: saccharopine dehydrogenase [Bacteroidetes bacterium 4572_114]
MKKIAILGAGLIGAPMAFDLASTGEFDVTVVDVDPANLEKFRGNKNIKTIERDLSKPDNVRAVVAGVDLVLSAVPGFMGFQTLKAVIEAGKNVIDIAFFPEDLFTLDELAKRNNVIAISDIGVAPGMSNILIGHVDHKLDKVEKAIIFVGGLPKERTWPFEYKAVFSPIDVIEEYTRPARYIENGKMVTRPALSDPELIEFPGIGTLEAFNSDGLRSLAETIDAPFMIEKTLRYIGHIDKMKVLRETGFFSKEPIEINGTMISPMDFTAKLLFPKWKLEDGEEDITVMRVIVEGEKSGVGYRYVYDLFDSYERATKVHSMARTTGYTATMALRMVTKGMYTRKGVSAPEFIGKHPKCVDFILKGLAERGV